MIYRQVGKEQQLEILVSDQKVKECSRSFRISIDGVSSLATVAQYNEVGWWPGDVLLL